MGLTDSLTRCRLPTMRVTSELPQTSDAGHINRSHGPSGSNRDYLVDLAHALRKLVADDPHVFELENELLTRSAHGI